MGRFLGKILGAFFGYMLAGPFGALLGLMIGNFFDKGVAQSGRVSHEAHIQIQKAFFKATFSVMGHVAKADGRISESEIQIARTIMRRMQLNTEQKAEAIAYFSEGKQSTFNLDEALSDLLRSCSRHFSLLKMFVEIQYQAAQVERRLNPEKTRILQTISTRLGFTPFFAYYQQSGYDPNQRRATHPRDTLSKAYTTLEIDKAATKAEVKRAYRKLMSQHHPDKLIAQGLPEEMIKIATEKSQNIQSAYEEIKKAKGFKF